MYAQLFYFKSDPFQNAQTVFQIFDPFCNKVCCQELSKIAQSGHTKFNSEFVRQIESTDDTPGQCDQIGRFIGLWGTF